jgi:DinB family protein
MKSGRPIAGEFAEYAAGDIGVVAGDDAVAALRSQQREILALLAGLEDKSIAGRTYAPGKWTFKQVIGHLIDDERIFAYRALCVARREPRPLPGFDEKEYMKATDFEHRTLAGLGAEYRAVRESSIAFFESLSADEWVRKGTVNEYAASVRGLAFHICGHELHHLRILREKYLP